VLLLALDTSTPSVGVAVCRDGVVLARCCVVDARRHGELLAVGVREVLSAAQLTPRQLEGIAVGVGPGPYTGLRIGLVTARSLGHALGIAVHGVCSLDVLARAVADELPGEYLVATDARRKEVYWARYHGGVRIEGPAVGTPGEVADTGPVVGEGALLYPQAFPDPRGPLYPEPGDLAGLVEEQLAAGTATLPPVPLYLRRPDAVAPGPAKKTVAQAVRPAR
jgi:tRNA threonylcarbamoyl adenosine modification protein YeaZ